MSATVNSTFPDPTTDFAEARKEGEKALNSASASASKFASGAKATATDFASNAAKSFKSAVEDQKTAGAGAIGDVARAAKGAADNFQDRAPELANAVRTVADRVEGISNDIRDRSVNDLMSSVTAFAGERPVTFFGLRHPGWPGHFEAFQFVKSIMGDSSSIFSDLSGYADRVAKLVQLDAALLSIETKENLQSVAISVVLVIGALATAFLGLVILLFAAVLFLIQLGLAPSFAALLAAVATFFVAGALAIIGIERLKSWTLTPRRTLAQFTSNLEALRASLRNEANS